MDLEEASAMTEASGLASDQNRPSGTKSAAEANGRRATVRFSEQLRKMILKAPLQSLGMAFLFGVVVAQRRRAGSMRGRS